MLLTDRERAREQAYKESMGGPVAEAGTFEVPIELVLEDGTAVRGIEAIRKALGDQIPPTIPMLQEECWQISEDHGFHDVGQSIGDKLMLIVSEAAEALEDHRDGHAPDETWYKENGKPCGIPSEIADIIIRCFDFAGCYGFDLEAIVFEKMDFNRTRPHLHGRTM